MNIQNQISANEYKSAISALADMFENEEVEEEDYVESIDEFLTWNDVHIDYNWLDGTDFQL